MRRLGGPLLPLGAFDVSGNKVLVGHGSPEVQGDCPLATFGYDRTRPEVVVAPFQNPPVRATLTEAYPPIVVASPRPATVRKLSTYGPTRGPKPMRKVHEAACSVADGCPATVYARWSCPALRPDGLRAARQRRSVVRSLVGIDYITSAPGSPVFT